MNVVVLEGTLSRPPEVRELPSGDHLVTYQVTVRSEDRPAESVPVVWVGRSARVGGLDAGEGVVVVGRVRRRFYRSPAGTRSSTEVVASAVVPARQRKRATVAIRAVEAELETRSSSS